jgi:hypothetical protein
MTMYVDDMAAEADLIMMLAWHLLKYNSKVRKRDQVQI